MSNPKLTLHDNYLLVELPRQALSRHEIESWISKVLAACRHSEIKKVLVWRKNPARLSLKPEEITRFVHLIDTMRVPSMRIALAFPADYYNEALDQLTLSAQARGIQMELFFDHEVARSWLLDA